MTEESPIALEFAPPAEDLQELVSTFYLFAADIEESTQTERADRAQLRFLLKGGGGYEFSDGVYIESAAVSIIGPTTGPRTGFIKGPVEIFGIGLQPAGWGSLMGADAERHVNRLIDAAELLGEGVLETHAAIAAAPTLADKVKIAETFMRELLKNAETSPVWFTRIVDEWLAGSASPALDDLIERTGLSSRQVERMTKRFYGATPKLLARKYRALRASTVLVSEDGDVEDVFYDQSHLIREIKAFTGVTPGKMRKEPQDLTRQIAEGRKMLAGKVSKLVTDT